MLPTILDHSNPKLVPFNKQQQLEGGGLKVKRSDMAEPLWGKISWSGNPSRICAESSDSGC